MFKDMPTIYLQGPCGQLETIIQKPPSDLIKGVMIILHPNPLYGGTNKNKVVQTILKASVNQHYVALAPNLRGVGKSAGQHNFGKGEVFDVQAILDFVQKEYPEKPVLLAGFSFGAFVAIKAVQDFNYHKVILIGAAIDKYEERAPYLPKHVACLLIHGEKDEIIPLFRLFNWARVQDIPVSVVLDATHFFHGKLKPLRQLIENFLA